MEKKMEYMSKKDKQKIMEKGIKDVMQSEKQKMYEHFSSVATTYGGMRTTDEEHIIYIAETLKHMDNIVAADIGCGDGRYDVLLFKHLNNLHLTCVDINDSMLEQTSLNLSKEGITNYQTIEAEAVILPLEESSMDCLFTFNTMNHFNIPKFLHEAARILKSGGLLLIYTRTRSQNARNIWGRYFPKFCEKENRLPELDEIKNMLDSSLHLERVKNFKFKRNDSLQRLLKKARDRFYSVFSLYEEKELDECIRKFEQNVIDNFEDINNLEWIDEYSLLMLKRDS
ncbi:MAG: class I SAM-dependent methyltransferase [Thermodesulfobacteriota bacterium]